MWDWIIALMGILTIVLVCLAIVALRKAPRRGHHRRPHTGSHTGHTGCHDGASDVTAALLSASVATGTCVRSPPTSAPIASAAPATTTSAAATTAAPATPAAVTASAPLALGGRKSRLILPYSAENDKACLTLAAPLTARAAPAENLNKSLRRHGRSGQVTLPTPLFERARKRLFFGVAINYVSQPNNRLHSCWNDVDTLHRTLGTRYGPFAQSWILSDRPESPPHQQPVRSNIQSTWNTILRTLRADPTRPVDLVFVYSGHGTFRLTTDPGELGGQSDALVLLDQLLYDYEVMSTMVRPLSTQVRLLMVFDSCNSGSAANLPWTYNPLSHSMNQTSLHTDLANDVVMISGCRDEQNSQGGPTAADVSACTRVLVETLRESPGPMLATDLVRQMRARLIQNKDTQIPQLSTSRPELMSVLL